MAGKRTARARLDHGGADRRQVTAAFGRGRHRRVLIEGIARVVARVVEEEKRARAVHDFRNHERPAERTRETLLQIARIGRRPVERVRRRVENRRVEVLRDVAADLILVAASAASGKSAAGTKAATTATLSTRATS